MHVGAGGQRQSPTMRLYLSPLPTCAACFISKRDTEGHHADARYVCSLLAGDKMDAHEGCERGGDDDKVVRSSVVRRARPEITI